MTAAELPFGLAENPRIGQWLGFADDGRVALRTGKVELGQGIRTALCQIAADELDVDLDQIDFVSTTTAGSPDENYTAGSRSIEFGGASVALVCANARRILLGAAARRLGAANGDLTVARGVIRAGEETCSYWDLASDAALLDVDADPDVATRSRSERRYVGRSIPRQDLPAKFAGEPAFLHDLVLPGMLHGRVVHPPVPGAHLVAITDDLLEALTRDEIRVVRESSFLGVLAEREEVAVAAAGRLATGAHWSAGFALPDESDLVSFLRAGPHETSVVVAQTPDPAPVTARDFRASYSRPYLAHASMGPACGVARWQDDHVDVWTASQGVFQLRQDLAAVFDLDASAFTLTHVEGPGCYGHNGADDAAFEAVCLARHAGGRPVRLLWSRADELGWAAYGPAAVVDIEVGIDDTGAMVRWHAELTGNGHSTRPGTIPEGPSFLSAPALGRGVARTIARDSRPLTMNGAGRNSVPCYRIPELEILSHRLLEMPIRTSSLRSLGANVNVFAIESMIDEVASGLGRDPVAFRLAHLDDPRMREVIETAAVRAGWAEERPPGSALGLAAARYKNTSAYCAVVAEVEAIDDVRVRRLTLVVDAGSLVNPDGVRNQIEGGAIQTLSWTLKERVRFDRERVTSTSWETYPILRFSEIPEVDVVLVERPDEPPLGVGEAVQGPLPAAVANAVFRASGVRARDLPITRERVAELAAGG